MVVRSECVGHRGIDERGRRLTIRRSRHDTIRDVCKWTMPISDWKAALTRRSRLRQLKSEPFTQNLGHSRPSGISSRRTRDLGTVVQFQMPQSNQRPQGMAIPTSCSLATFNPVRWE